VLEDVRRGDGSAQPKFAQIPARVRGRILNNLMAPALRTESSGPIAVADDFTEHIAEGVADVLIKPRLRGWIHLYCAAAAAIAGAALVAVSWAAVSKRAGHSTLAYTAAILAMFAVSAIYHRVNWQSATTRKRMRQLDHSMPGRACHSGSNSDATRRNPSMLEPVHGPRRLERVPHHSTHTERDVQADLQWPPRSGYRRGAHHRCLSGCFSF